MGEEGKIYMKDIFEKARNKPTKPWYMVKIKHYQIPFWALPVAPFVIGFGKLNDWLFDRIQWDEDKAIKVLNHVLPQILDYDKVEDAYYYCMDWGTSNLWHKAPLRYRCFAYKYALKLRKFIRDKYMIKCCYKSVIVDWDQEWVKFRCIKFKEG